MELKPTNMDPTMIPKVLRRILSRAVIYDSSCSDTAQTVFVDVREGFFLKISETEGALQEEARMTRFFNEMGLGARLVMYTNYNGRDYLMTEKLPGQDLIDPAYLAEPDRLARLFGETLRMLHDTKPGDAKPGDIEADGPGPDAKVSDDTKPDEADQSLASGCPVQDGTERFIESARRGHGSEPESELYADKYFCVTDFHPKTEAEAWEYFEANCHKLEQNVLIHGDYCLPNVIFDDWEFSGFVDLGHAGIADRHIDLYWGLWSLNFNFGTDRYNDIFLDAYGRDLVDPERICIVAAGERFTD